MLNIEPVPCSEQPGRWGVTVDRRCRCGQIAGVMDSSPARFWFDYIDPASFLVDLLLREMGPEGGTTPPSFCPLEVVPPPGALLDPAGGPWRDQLEAMRPEARRMGVVLTPPPLVPWSRKAHELALHAREKGCFPQIHRAIFDGFFRESRDIGRVDVLVDIAVAAGLDGAEVRTVLGVDRFAAAVEEERWAAAEAGVRGVPTLVRGTQRIEGLCGRKALEDLLRAG